MSTDRWDVMSPRKKKDGGTYWHKVGTAFQGSKGVNIIFDSLPLPDAEGRVAVSLFEPRERQAPPASQQSGTASHPRLGGGGRTTADDLADENPL